MDDILDLIRYSNECSYLDFKAVQYKKDKYHELVKDISAFANAFTQNERFIIIGIKSSPNGTKDIIGIQEAFIDSSTYEQIIHANIEPEINFKYFSFEYEDKTLGVIEITDTIDKPYILKKDFGATLKK